MKRFLAMGLTLAALGCGNSDSAPVATDTGTAPVDTGTAPKDTGAADTTVADTGPKDTGAAADTSKGDADEDVPYVPTSAAKAFCDAYKPKCPFGTKPNYYADYDSCTRTYDAYSTSQQYCTQKELAAGNCDGASGDPPCDK